MILNKNTTELFYTQTVILNDREYIIRLRNETIMITQLGGIGSYVMTFDELYNLMKNDYESKHITKTN